MKLVQLVLAGLILAVLFGAPVAPVFAMPNARNCGAENAAISSPQSGAAVTGIVQIEGTASLGAADFKYYKLEVAPAGTEAWGDLAGQAQNQVVNGQLGVWDSAGVADGAYMLRLRVVDPTGNYCEIIITGIRVQNSVPTAVPTAAETITPTEAPPVKNAVPTPLPTTPVAEGTGTPVVTITPPRAGPSRTPEAGSGGIGGIEITQIVKAVQNFFLALARVFVFGAIAMGAIFFFVGVVYFVRRVL